MGTEVGIGKNSNSHGMDLFKKYKFTAVPSGIPLKKSMAHSPSTTGPGLPIGLKCRVVDVPNDAVCYPDFGYVNPPAAGSAHGALVDFQGRHQYVGAVHVQTQFQNQLVLGKTRQRLDLLGKINGRKRLTSLATAEFVQLVDVSARELPGVFA